MKEKKFIEYLNDKTVLPHSSIIQAIDTGEFPFIKNSFFSHNPQFLASDEFNRCVQLFKEKANGASQEDLQHVIALMILHENNVREQLQEIGIEAVRIMYDIPEKINLTAKIKWTEEIDENHKAGKKLSETRMHELRNEIEKRRILNSIIHGSAIHQWISTYYIVEEKINEINPELIGIYNQFTAMVNYFNWMHPVATDFSLLKTKLFSYSNQSLSGLIIQGKYSINYKSKKIEAIGLSLPIIIHELLKSTMEYLMSAGIPNHLKDEEIKYIFEKADKHEHEFWNYYMGPTLWRAILNTANVPPYELPKIMSFISQMDYEELAMFCTKITFDPEDTGRTAMNKIKRHLKIQNA